MLWRNIKQGRWMGAIGGGRKDLLFEKVAFGQRPEEDERAHHVDTWGKKMLGRGGSQCKGPEAGACLIC